MYGAAILVGEINNVFGQAEDERPMPWLENYTETVPEDHLPFIQRIQLGAVGKAIELLQVNGNEVQYIDQSSWNHTGIDLISAGTDGTALKIVEVKGTTRGIKNSPAAYLRKTRTKGYQLSWEWCWCSTTELACLCTTAKAFFLLLKPLLYGNIQRELIAVDFEITDDPVWPIRHFKTWTEGDFAEIPKLAAPYDLEKQRRWFEEIEEGAILGYAELSKGIDLGLGIVDLLSD